MTTLFVTIYFLKSMDSIVLNTSEYNQYIDWVPLSLTFVEYPKGKRGCLIHLQYIKVL